MQAEDIRQIERQLGLTFKDPTHLEQAFQISMAPGVKTPGAHQASKLAHIGDAFITYIVTIHLHRDPDMTIGQAQQTIDQLVGRTAFDQLVAELGFDRYLFGDRPAGRIHPKTVFNLRAELFEAIIGAILLEHGADVAERAVCRLVLSRTNTLTANGRNPKGMLQNLCQQLYGQNPTYKVMEKCGTAHQPLYQVGAFIGERFLVEAMDGSIGAAERKAALMAIPILELEMSRPD